MNFPGGSALKVLVGCVALPQALDERGGGRDLTVEVLLPLLLLDFESEPGAKYALWKTKKLSPIIVLNFFNRTG